MGESKELNRMFKLGEGSGMQFAGDYIMQMALKEFESHAMAEKLREIATELCQKGHALCRKHKRC